LSVNARAIPTERIGEMQSSISTKQTRADRLARALLHDWEAQSAHRIERASGNTFRLLGEIAAPALAKALAVS
jgi:hypothetical protein